MKFGWLGLVNTGNSPNLRDFRSDDSIGLVFISLELLEQAQYMGFAFPFLAPKTLNSFQQKNLDRSCHIVVPLLLVYGLKTS